MFKKLVLFTVFSVIALNLFCESKKIKYIKGNIADKTAALKEASGDELNWLCENALDFVLENKEILGTDRDLDGLAVATVLSINNDYINSLSDRQKFVLMNKFTDLFEKFNSSAIVQTSIISKIVSLKDELAYNDFTALLNKYISKNNINQIDSSVAKSIFSSLEVIGNNESFLILYTLWTNPKYKNYSENIESALVALIPSSMNEVLNLIHSKESSQIEQIYSLIKNNSKISTIFACEIAENIISESIIIVENSSDINDKLLNIQIESLKLLSQNKWTRASSLALSYFKMAKKLFENNQIKESDMQSVISSLSNLSPVNAVAPLSKYLEELNNKKEQNEPVSTEIVLSIINTLGAIGDKSAFDSLLAVTYIAYPESVLLAAREALAGLRW